MKKLMIAAAAAAMIGGAYAGDCTPEAKECSIVYQMQLNVYTTKGVALGYSSGSQCAPGSTCVVMRGRDKTVIRGYVYICGCGCDVTQYSDVFCDSRRHALFDTTQNSLTWKFAHIMGANLTDAECGWQFGGKIAYDATRESTYDLAGAGYGTFNGEFFTGFAGYFAGWVDKTYDLTTKGAEATPSACLCEPSMVVYCSDLGTWTADAEGASVAFGSWKMKYNANVSNAYNKGKWGPLEAIRKAMK